MPTGWIYPLFIHALDKKRKKKCYSVGKFHFHLELRTNFYHRIHSMPVIISYIYIYIEKFLSDVVFYYEIRNIYILHLNRQT